MATFIDCNTKLKYIKAGVVVAAGLLIIIRIFVKTFCPLLYFLRILNFFEDIAPDSNNYSHRISSICKKTPTATLKEFEGRS